MRLEAIVAELQQLRPAVERYEELRRQVELAAGEPEVVDEDPEQVDVSSVMEAAVGGGSLPAGFWVENKMVGKYGPYKYLRWREGNRQRSRYLGKAG